MKKLLKKKKAFTLIELLICLFIIGLMMLLIIPNIAKQREEAQKKSDAAIVKVIENQQELYQLDKNVKEKPDAQALKCTAPQKLDIKNLTFGVFFYEINL